MERELGLRPSQKLKKWMLESDKTLPPKTLMAFQERYDSAIKNELDLHQQKKYDELRKSGMLPGGVRVALNVGRDPEKE